MKYLYSILNDLIVIIAFITATLVQTGHHPILGMFLFLLAFMLLDFHSYIDKKLNYPNNLFIKSERL